jgi:hypothetical protein
MMKTWLSLLLGGVLLFIRHPLTAQSNDPLDKMTQLMNEMQSAYSMQRLSFDVKYVYSNEHTPNVILDSLNGKVEMDGLNYRCLLDNTETIRNAKYAIILFKEDKIMYLTKSSGADSSGNPLLVTRAALQSSNIKKCEITIKGDKKIVNVEFNAGAPYKKMDMVIDKVTGLVMNMEYVVKTSMLVTTSSDEASLDESYEEYASVRAYFLNYQKMLVDKERFDERAFFFREADAFKPTAAYKDYKLFLATPHL